VFDKIRSPELEEDAPFKIYLDVDREISDDNKT
jgi:hypothetical protein